MRIRIHAGQHQLEAELSDCGTARALYEALPMTFHGSTWGDEVYGSVPIDAADPADTAILEIGDLGFWPPGHAFCIFYGPTPASTDERPVPASEVVYLGRILDDATVLRGSSSCEVRLEAMQGRQG